LKLTGPSLSTSRKLRCVSPPARELTRTVVAKCIWPTYTTSAGVIALNYATFATDASVVVDGAPEVLQSS